MEYSTQGRHVLVDAWGVSFEKLNDIEKIKAVMVYSAKVSGADVISVQEKQFEPNGLTVLVLLSESHFSIHTYPEKGFAGIDCYTCGDNVDPMVAVYILLKYLQPKKVSTTSVSRGTNEGIKLIGVR